MKSEVEDVFATHLDEMGIEYKRDARFCERGWMLDFYLPEHSIGIELMGGIWSRGRHTRGQGYQDDCIKANEATMRGIRVLRFTTEDVNSLRAKRFLAEWVIEREKEKP